VLADVLADLEATPVDGVAPVGRDVLDEARALLEEAAAEATAVGGWTEAEPLRLAKGSVTWLVRCPRRAVAPPEGGTGDELVLGSIVDAAAKLAALGARRPVTASTALAYLGALGETDAADHLEAVGEPAAARLMAEAEERVARLVAVWPSVSPEWWPRVEEPARVRLAGGAVTVTGRLDVLLGGPPTGRPGLVVEIKGGRWYDGMRADAHLYALLVGLRDGEAPARVVTLVADGTTQVEPIRPTLVRHAAERVELALRTAARLAAGEVAEARPGSHCGHCPVRAECPVAA
jgi:PD-(D/E)XK nuclease superfamily protein